LPSIEIPLPELLPEPATNMSLEEDLETDISMDDEVITLATPDLTEEHDVEFDLTADEEIAEPADMQIEVETVTAGPDLIETVSPSIEPESGIAEPFYGTEAVAYDGAPAVEDIGEIDFYIEQELFDEAREKVEALLSRYPGNIDVLERADRLEASVLSVGTMAQPAPVDRDHDLLSTIQDLDDDLLAPPPPPPAAHLEQDFPPLQTAQEENLFADEDDFFDLAAELEEELDEETDEIVSLSEEEQSLEEIFREFKKGVEQQLDSEDYDTHYNLGIAYKEMGLIDEAIGEFQLASKDTQRAVECASMLGLCFLEKGMPQLAIKWYRKGLEMPEIKEDEHVGLLYDLGSAFMEVGDTTNAQKAFMEVYGMNSSYRDVANRIKQLQDVK
jgi:pilus assembly protein FimV